MHMMHMWVVASAEILCLHQHNNTHTHARIMPTAAACHAGFHSCFICMYICVCVYAGDSLYRYWVNALPTAENEATAMRMLPTASENTVNSVSVNKRTTHTHSRTHSNTDTHIYIYT